MPRYLIGFDDEAPLDEGESVGLADLTWWEKLAAGLTGGASLPFSLSKAAYQYVTDDGSPAGQGWGDTTNDPKKLAAYRQAAAALAAAQARQGQSHSSYSPIALNVGPSGVQPLRESAPIDYGLPSLPTLDLSSFGPSQTVTGAVMSSKHAAIVGVEIETKKCGRHASIDKAGCTSCPNCHKPLHIKLDLGPVKAPGEPAGHATVVGVDAPGPAASSPVLKAVSPSTCVCCCPYCGCAISLSLTDEGYDPALATHAGSSYSHGGHNQVVGSRVEPIDPTIQVFGYWPNGRPVLGSRVSPIEPSIDVFGAVKPKTRQPVARGKISAPGGSPHKAVIKSSGNAVAKSAKAGAMASARAKKYDPAKHKPIVPLTSVKGWGDEAVIGIAPFVDTIVVMGVEFGVDKPLTAAQKDAVAKHTAAVAKTAAAYKKAADLGAKATAASKALDQKRKVAAPIVAKLINRASPSLGKLKSAPAGHQQVLGGSTITVFGLDSSGRAPGQDGYDPSSEDGTGAGGGGGSYPAPLPIYTSTDPNAEGGCPDCIPMPVRGQTLDAANAAVVWRKCPDDAIKYAGDKGTPSDCFGSYNIEYVTKWDNERAGDGFVWHGQDGNPPIWWAVRRGHGDAQHAGDTIAESSLQFGWGPLVGNPDSELAGLQWAMDDKCWFFQSSVAPAWSCVEADTALTALNIETLKTVNAANAATNARIAAEQAEDQENAARQAAANALAQSASDQQSAIDAARQATQDAALDLQQKQYDQDAAARQAAADLAASNADLALQAKNVQQDQLARQIQLEYLQQHPEALADAQQDDGQYQGDVEPQFQQDNFDAGYAADPSFFNDVAVDDELGETDFAAGF